MAWVAHVWIDSAVGSVGSSSLLGCLVDLDVLDKEIVGVQAFGISIGLGVLEETKEELGGLDWVSGFRYTKVLA